jgi:hypothetical protein
LGQIGRSYAASWLVLVSLVFYAYWSPRFLVILLVSVLFNYSMSELIAARAQQPVWQSWLLGFAVAGNLSALAYYKYLFVLFAFLRGNGLVDVPFAAVVLPLGISFFTFHHIMYLVDLRRGRAPLYALDRYALYIAFFPQLLAGPLVRWSEVMEQFGRKVYVTGWQREFAVAICFITIGLVEKIFLADRIAHNIDPVYLQAQAGVVTNGDAWLALAFNIQILFDFAGYSDIAIGLGLLFGIKLPFNFNAPFHATSIQDFWQRWHITLMNFLRDYVYFPLVNARVLPRRFLPLQSQAAMLITMVLCGLWHGANWTFILWGTLHGCALVVAALWRRHGPRMPTLLGRALTVMFVLLTGVIFRATSLDAALNIFQGLGYALNLDRGKHLLSLAIVPLIAFLSPSSQDIIAWLTRRPRPWLFVLAGFILFVILLDLGERNVAGFGYFNF